MNTASNNQINEVLRRNGIDAEQANAVIAYLNGNAKITLYKVRPVKVEPVALPCPCGCDKVAKPGSRFLPGHDSAVKGMLQRARKWQQANEEERTKLKADSFPQVLVDRATNDPEFFVAKFDAAAILELAEVVGSE